MKNSGFHLVLVAPDGSGKTTLMAGLGSRMLPTPFTAIRSYHSTFGILPRLGAARKLAGGRPQEQALPPGTALSGMGPQHHPLRSLIYVLYYGLDMCLGRMTLSRLKGQGALVVFDRYFYDYCFQLGNRRLPQWVLNTVGLLVPKPDLAVCLEDDAEAIFARKPELSVEEIRTQQGIIRRWAEGKPYARIVDARGGIEATLEKVEQLIREELQCRMKNAE